MLYTRKGDNGTTKTFGCDQRISKSSAIAEALGSLDEINSFLGICKIRAKDSEFTVGDLKIDLIVHDIQQTLFIIQAELAGADKKVTEEKVTRLETIVDSIEKILPPIKTFFISGGSELAALFDIARTIARRAERRVVAVSEDSVTNSGQAGVKKVSPETLKYLNRLSSVLYALARLSNHLAGVSEQAPVYK